MKNYNNLQQKPDRGKTGFFLFVAFILLIIIGTCTSCSKPEIHHTSMLELNITITNFGNDKEKGTRCHKARPVIAELSTDKGVFTFDLVPIAGGFHTQKMEIEAGEYVLQSLILIDEEGTITHYGHQGAPPQSSIVATWLDGHEYDLTNDFTFRMQVFCN